MSRFTRADDSITMRPRLAFDGVTGFDSRISSSVKCDLAQRCKMERLFCEDPESAAIYHQQTIACAQCRGTFHRVCVEYRFAEETENCYYLCVSCDDIINGRQMHCQGPRGLELLCRAKPCCQVVAYGAKIPANHHDRWITCKLCSSTFHRYCVSYFIPSQDQYTCTCCCKK